MDTDTIEIDWPRLFEGLHTALATAAVRPARGAELTRLRRARAFIERSSGEALDLDAMAAAARLSRFHFLRRFRVRIDVTMGDGFRWLTVGAKGQPELEIALMQPRVGPIYDAETIAMITELQKRGAFGGGVFTTDDVQKDYEALKARGVEFRSPPTEKPYGIEAVFRDDSGNWFSLTQH